MEPNHNDRKILTCIKCLLCKNKLASKSELAVHIKEDHVQPCTESLSFGESMFRCLECKKTFSNVNILEDHVEEKHKGSQPYLKLQHSNDEDIALIADNKNIVDSMDKCSEYDKKAWMTMKIKFKVFPLQENQRHLQRLLKRPRILWL